MRRSKTLFQMVFPYDMVIYMFRLIRLESLSPFIYGLALGTLTAGLALSVLIALWLTSSEETLTTTMTVNGKILKIVLKCII